MRIAVFASGSGSNFKALAQAFPAEVQLLFSDKIDAYALQRAQQLNIAAVSFTLKSFANKQSYEEALVALLREHQIDLICLAGYMKIVGPTLLQAYEGRIINIHPSYLPAFAGSAHALEESWQAQEGLGITVHWVDSGVDTGEILAQQQLDYYPELAEYEKKLHQTEHELYIKVVEELIKNSKSYYKLKNRKGIKMTKRALISVSDKNGIVELAESLSKLGFEIISTGGTKKALDEAGIATLAIEEVTHFPEMMDGRVKTLHPMIHGGLLARRDLDSHLAALEEHNITPIDLIVVNLYPFKETLLSGADHQTIVENIDIGGPSMLRSAAKNHADVTVLVDPTDYAAVLQEFKKAGETSLELRQRLAAKVFRHTAAYDALIAQYLTEKFSDHEEKPEKLTLTYDLKQRMRYGENPQQDADFYENALPTAYSIGQSVQLHGKELSYNNVRDADAALQIARDFTEQPTVVALKHMNPCGIGQGETIEKAWDYAYEADPVSIFGGIVVLNRLVDQKTAEKMSKIFLEIIIAPAFSDEALAILTKKKNIRLLTLDFEQIGASEKEAMMTGVLGGVLVQEQDVVAEQEESWIVATQAQPDTKQWEALKFAWKAVKYVKSNGIIVTNEHQTLGVGPGQTNRVASVKIAIEAAQEKNIDNAVLASDAFFPFADNIDEIAKSGIKAIVQPGGSVRDQEVIEACDKYGITMIFTGVRHFRH